MIRKICGFFSGKVLIKHYISTWSLYHNQYIIVNETTSRTNITAIKESNNQSLSSSAIIRKDIHIQIHYNWKHVWLRHAQCIRCQNSYWALIWLYYSTPHDTNCSHNFSVISTTARFASFMMVPTECHLFVLSSDLSEWTSHPDLSHYLENIVEWFCSNRLYFWPSPTIKLTKYFIDIFPSLVYKNS